MRFALFIMLLACGEKDEDTAVTEEETEVADDEIMFGISYAGTATNKQQGD